MLEVLEACICIKELIYMGFDISHMGCQRKFGLRRSARQPSVERGLYLLDF